MERQTNKIGHAATGSVALPAVMRAGGPGVVCITLFHQLLKSKSILSTSLMPAFLLIQGHEDLIGTVKKNIKDYRLKQLKFFE